MKNSRTFIRPAIINLSVAALFALSAPVAAQAQNLPSYASGEESIRGRITTFDGKYRLELRDDRGFVDRVQLHDGTIINPTGLRLASGQSVTVLGHTSGKIFAANEIDTPYANYGGPLPYGYGYGSYAYPYPAYGYAPYGYPYRYRGYDNPRIGIGFRDRGFGVRGWF